MSNDSPSVTVLMPVFNGMPYLQEAVQSMLQQSYQHFVLLVVNDGSTDGSREFLEGLADERVRVLHRPKEGLGAALNAGLGACDTEFVARMDGDDLSLRDRLAAQRAFLRANPDVGVVGTQLAYLGTRRSGFASALPLDHDSIQRNLRRGEHAISHATIMFRRSSLDRVGGYRPDGIDQDWDFLMRLSEATRLANLPDVLFLYRLHGGSVSSTRLEDCRTQIAYARCCARKRAASEREPTLAEFLAAESDVAWLRRLARNLDVHSWAQYRQAMADVLGDRPAAGYARLAFAGLCSPSRSCRWVARAASRRAARSSLRRSAGSAQATVSPGSVSS
jgi:glycosyltransferase involved in cell wall biosynthesis